jgi:RNA polymerase sigma factor (sigma-70 family)
VAKRWTGGPLELDDLVQAGSIGLMRAVEKFDPSRGTKLSTYAYHWISQSIRVAVRGARPFRAHDDADPATIPRIAASLDQPATRHGDGGSLRDSIADPGDDYAASDDFLTAHDALTEIADAETRVAVRMRYFGNGRPGGATLSEIGEELRVSPERALQMVLAGVSAIGERGRLPRKTRSAR